MFIEEDDPEEDKEWDTRPEKVIRTEPDQHSIEFTPSAGCWVCEEWHLARCIATDEGKLSEALDCHLLLRKHHQAEHPDDPSPPLEFE